MKYFLLQLGLWLSVGAMLVQWFRGIYEAFYMFMGDEYL